MQRLQPNDTRRTGPRRSCVACRATRPASELIRFALRDGAVTVDMRRRLPGRGANLCASRSCLQQALKRGAFRRAFRGHGQAVFTELERAIRHELSGEIERLKLAATRSGHSHGLSVSRRDYQAPKTATDGDLVSNRLRRGRGPWLVTALAEFTLPYPGVMNPAPTRRRGSMREPNFRGDE